MQTIEVTGKSLDEATQQAAKQLGVPTDQLMVRVLEQSKGLFGRGSVRIQATAQVPETPVTDQPEVEVMTEAKTSGESVEVSEPEPVEVASSEEREGDQAEVVATDEDAQYILGVVKSLLDKAGLEVITETKPPSGKYITVIIDGKDSSTLIGKHGEVINSLQYLVNIMLNQHRKNGVRATLDCDNYRQRREDALAKLARNIAAQVIDRGEEAVLDALPAFERRVIHKTLVEFDGVTTKSEGEEPNRRVVIIPND